jgi:hypothetical protein
MPTSSLTLIQLPNPHRVQHTLDRRPAIPKIHPHERAHHVQRTHCRIATPHLAVSLPGRHTPTHVRVPLLEGGQQGTGRRHAALVQQRGLREVQDPGDDAYQCDEGGVRGLSG